MVGGLAGERRLHRDRARDAAGTRLSGPDAAPDAGAGEGLRGAGRGGATRGGRLGKQSRNPPAISPPCLRRSPRSNPPPPLPPPPPPRGRRRCLRLFLLLLRPVPLRPPRVAVPGLPAPPPSGARIREARRSGGRGGDGPPHLHAICMRPARARPPARPARLICMHIPRRHIPGLNPAAPGAARGERGRRAGEGSGPRWEGGAWRALPAPSGVPRVSPGPGVSGGFGFGDWKELRRSARPAQPSPTPGKAQDSRRKGVGSSLPAEGKGPANAEGTKGPPRRAPSPLGPEGGPRRRPSVQSTQSATVARPGAVAPGASAGRLAL